MVITFYNAIQNDKYEYARRIAEILVVKSHCLSL